MAFILAGTVCPGAEAVAEEADKAAASAALSNIGFMKNPPKELTEKFPMCDAFLKVDWIDKKKKIGYTHYEARLLNDKGVLRPEKKMVWALVQLHDEWPSYKLDVYQYKRQGRMNELYEMVREGKPTWVPMNYAIKYKGKINVFYGQLSPVLSENRQTVCIPYPDGQTAWIIEGKTVRQTYDDEQISNIEAMITETGGRFSKKRLNSLWVLDVNFDGKDDLVLDVSCAYSWSERMYQIGHVRGVDGYKQIFPPKNRECYLGTFGIYPLTTDGKSYRISNQCNLTELTSYSENERDNGKISSEQK